MQIEHGTFESRLGPGMLAAMLNTRDLMNFSYRTWTFCPKIQGFWFPAANPPTPKKNCHRTGFPSLNNKLRIYRESRTVRDTACTLFAVRPRAVAVELPFHSFFQLIIMCPRLNVLGY